MKLRFGLRNFLFLHSLVLLVVVLVFSRQRIIRLNERLFDEVVNGDSTTVSLLIREGASPNATDEFGYSPLFYAIEHRRKHVAHALLESGADPNIARKGWLTPLGQAIIHKDLELIRTLLRYGADATANRGQLNDCVDLAVRTGNERVIREISQAIGEELIGLSEGEQRQPDR